MDKMQATAFSIATPVRNALPMLRRCVGSVRRQTGVDAEHLVQDAASTDGTVEWLRTQAGLTWTSEHDNGMYDAITRAWNRSHGAVLSWLNADEQYLPGTLDYVARIFTEEPSTDAVFGDYIICDTETGVPVAARREIQLRRFYLRHGPLYAMSCTLFFRRRLLERGLLKFQPDLRVVADAGLVMRLLNSGVRFRHVRRYLALFGVKGTNMSVTDAGMEETMRLRRQQEGPTGLSIRPLARLLRIIEKAAAGSYGKKRVDYEFCVDETGHSKRIVADNVSPRWRWGACSWRQ